jgi:hypothetical protein
MRTYDPVQDSLGGSSKTVIIANVSPSSWFVLHISGSEFTQDTIH